MENSFSCLENISLTQIISSLSLCLFVIERWPKRQRFSYQIAGKIKYFPSIVGKKVGGR